VAGKEEKRNEKEEKRKEMEEMYTERLGGKHPLNKFLVTALAVMSGLRRWQYLSGTCILPYFNA